MALSISQVEDFLAVGPAIDVRLAALKGSSPREVGAWMLVSQNNVTGTIGGGQLEYMMIDEARKMLRNAQSSNQLDVPLGPEIGQCCGGHVSIELRLVTEPKQVLQRVCDEFEAQPDILIFGAGHVGKALARSLSLLPVNTILIDQRQDELPRIDGVENRLSPLPEAELRVAKPGSAIVVLTHDHALDFLIAGEALALGHFSYVGMIGSKTKRATFKSWLREAYDGDVNASEMVCPIGGQKGTDKRPEVIAALIAAEIIQTLDQAGLLVIKNCVGGMVDAG